MASSSAAGGEEEEKNRVKLSKKLRNRSCEPADGLKTPTVTSTRRHQRDSLRTPLAAMILSTSITSYFNLRQ